MLVKKIQVYFFTYLLHKPFYMIIHTQTNYILQIQIIVILQGCAFLYVHVCNFICTSTVVELILDTFSKSYEI